MCVEAVGWRKRRNGFGLAEQLFIAGPVQLICGRGVAARTGGAFWRDDQRGLGCAEEIGHHQKNRPGMVKVVATKELHFCASCAPGLPGIAGKTSFILMRAVSRPVFTGRMAGRLGATRSLVQSPATTMNEPISSWHSGAKPGSPRCCLGQIVPILPSRH